jgi:hypothetical protein
MPKKINFLEYLRNYLTQGLRRNEVKFDYIICFLYYWLNEEYTHSLDWPLWIHSTTAVISRLFGYIVLLLLFLASL